MACIESTGAVLHAKLDISASGDTTLVAATAGKRIRVLSVALMAAGSVSATFKSDSTPLTGPLSLATGQPLEAAAGWGCFQTAAGEALLLNLSAAVQVSGWIAYQIIA